jgi:hypothetical protein
VRARVDADLVAEVNANGAAFVASGSVLQDSMLEAQAQVISNGGSNPIVLVNPADYVKAMTAKASTAGSYLGTPQGLGTIVASSSVTAGKLIAFDPSALTLFIRQDYELFVGYQGDQFVRNALTLLGELRAVPSVIMPALVVHGNLAKA